MPTFDRAGSTASAHPRTGARNPRARNLRARNPRARNPWIVFALLAVTQFMVVLDTSIVYIALPSIDRELGFSGIGVAWVMDAYILAFGGFMLLGGRAADLWGRRRVLVAGLVGFGLASLACGISAEPWQIVAARTAQGLTAAVVAPAALALVTDVFAEGRERYKALGIFGGMGGVGGAAGVLFGGALTAIGWQWAFLVNVPLAIVLIAFALRLVPATEPRAGGGLDLVGALSGSGGLCLFLYAVMRASMDGWTSASVLVQILGALLLLATFVLRQLRAAAPLIPRMLFRLRNVVLGNAANATVGALLFGVFLIITLYLQQVRGYSPIPAALRMAPISVFLFLGSQLTVRLIGRVGAPNALAAGGLLQAAALAWWALVLDPLRHIFPSFLLPGAVWGLGCGVTIVAAFVVCTSGVPGPVRGAASGLVSTTLQIGGAIGVTGLSLIAHARAAVVPDLGNGVHAPASGQAYALGVAAVLALVGVGLILWLRRSWQLPAASGGPR